MREVQVSMSEYTALQYLYGTLSAAHKMQKQYHEDRGDLLITGEGSLFRRMDWRRVAQECAPDVLVVLAHDGTRNSEKFDEFPLYALIPRLGEFLHLQDEVTLSIEEGSDVRREQVVSALKLLKLRIASVDGPKQDNARKLLSGLHKLLLN